MKRLLFLCVENSCRSQMAEGFAHVLGRNIIDACSAGSKPSGKVDTLAIEAMGEVGIDISKYRSKGFDDLSVKNFDFVITLGCKDTCPFVGADKHIEWQIEDPKGKGIDVFIKVRDDIRNRICRFIKETA